MILQIKLKYWKVKSKVLHKILEWSWNLYKYLYFNKLDVEGWKCLITDKEQQKKLIKIYKSKGLLNGINEYSIKTGFYHKRDARKELLKVATEYEARYFSNFDELINKMYGFVNKNTN